MSLRNFKIFLEQSNCALVWQIKWLDGIKNVRYIYENWWGIDLAGSLFVFHKKYSPSTIIETTFWDVKSV